MLTEPAHDIGAGAVKHGPAILTFNIRGLRTKTEHIKTLFTRRHCDFVLLQETNMTSQYEQGVMHKLGLKGDRGHFINSKNSFCNGTGIIQTSNRWEIKEKGGGLDGRLASVDVTDGKAWFTIVSLYAPAVVDDGVKGAFFEDVDTWIKNHVRHPLILGGGL